jgi:hypothetical protein
MFATGIGSLIRITIEVFEVLKVLGAIVGFDLEAFNGLPDQFLLVIGTFEVLVDDFFPFFGGDGRKLGE